MFEGFRHLGGALAQPSDSAAGHLTEPFALYMFGIPSDPETAAAVPDGRDLTSALTTLVHKVRRVLLAGRLVT